MMAFGVNLNLITGQSGCARRTGRTRPAVRSELSVDPAEEKQVHRARLSSWHRHDAVVQPGDTDYSGYMWHGNYLRLLEAARVELMLACGLNYGTLVSEYGMETPVVDMKLRYRRPAKLRDSVCVLSKGERKGIRLCIKGQILRAGDMELLLESEATLVFVNMNTGLPVRRIPPEIEEACRRFANFGEESLNEE
mmetsp:Transcript_1332/g.4017  ORF Transcript_1332/g.4017 Transcript_1332/m.4017 type:complete len:194 (+) Transcript_1332:90-671(+)